MLGCQWRRINQEEAFVGRAAEAGDELGSGVITARLVRDCARLAFLVERRHAPYSKWLMTAMVRWLACGPVLAAMLERAMGATDADARQAALCDAYEYLGTRTNDLGLAPAVDVERRPFHARARSRWARRATWRRRCSRPSAIPRCGPCGRTARWTK